MYLPCGPGDDMVLYWVSKGCISLVVLVMIWSCLGSVCCRRSCVLGVSI